MSDGWNELAWAEGDLSRAIEREGKLQARIAELRSALESAARSLESAGARSKVDDDEVRAYCLSRATVARAALEATR